MKGQDDRVAFSDDPVGNDLSEEKEYFDVIGDIHGCYEELRDLLQALGYEIDGNGLCRTAASRRKVVFLGDLVDRGPMTPAVLALVMDMVASGMALCILGNHEEKLLRALKGRKVIIDHGLRESMEQLKGESEQFITEVMGFLDSLSAHCLLDGGKLVVAHAGLPESMHGKQSRSARSFALYGKTTGGVDEFGLPVRENWAEDYRGLAMVVYGHTPVSEPKWLNKTICLDTGCVYGGKLTALRYPELELASIPARRVYYERSRPFD